MFEDSTFETYGIIRTHSRNWMVAVLALNSLIVLALILFPLIYPQVLPQQMIPFLLETPLHPHAPQQQLQQPAHAASAATEAQPPQIQAPRIIPISIATENAPAVPPNNPISSHWYDQSVPDGAISVFPGKTIPPIVRSQPTGPVRVTTDVVEGLLLQETVPSYPAIARVTHTEGTVVLEATISKTGVIENLRVMSGPLLLQQAALDAVRTWRYKPYLLDGQPIEVETTVNVVFNLSR